jgi:two-component system, chemotaxis family, chemotaxis protein CheY
MAKRILIVDDMLFMRMKLKGLLEKLGYHVVGEGGNGREGLEKYKLLKPEVVLMDITMPEMDGLTALREIMAFDSKANVVMVSAVGQEKNVMEAIMLGAKNFVVKPFQNEKIAEVLSAL